MNPLDPAAGESTGLRVLLLQACCQRSAASFEGKDRVFGCVSCPGAAGDVVRIVLRRFGVERNRSCPEKLCPSNGKVGQRMGEQREITTLAHCMASLNACFASPGMFLLLHHLTPSSPSVFNTLLSHCSLAGGKGEEGTVS